VSPELNEAEQWGYHTPPEQQEHLDAVYGKARRLASRREPQGFMVTHSLHRYRSLHPEHPDEFTHVVRASEVDSEGFLGHTTGSIEWDGVSGKVHWLGGDKETVPHLMARAHAEASKLGHAPPTHSEDLSHHSYRLMSKYLPEHIPNDATASGIPVKVSPEHFSRIHEGVTEVHAAATPHMPEERVAEWSSRAKEVRESALRAGHLHQKALTSDAAAQSYHDHLGTIVHGLVSMARHASSIKHPVGAESARKLWALTATAVPRIPG
jgi:hypothetical protein